MQLEFLLDSLDRIRADIAMTHDALVMHVKKLSTIARDDEHHRLLATLMMLQRCLHETKLVLETAPRR